MGRDGSANTRKRGSSPDGDLAESARSVDGDHRWAVERKEPPTARGQRTQERIARSARQLFCRRDYGEVSVAEIAEDSGVSVGTVYTYYESKEDIFLELLSEVFKGVFNAAKHAWRADRDLYDNLVATTRCTLAAYFENRQVIRSAYQLAGQDKRVRSVLWGCRRDVSAMMMPRLLEDQATSASAPLEPERLLRALTTMVDDYAWRVYAEGEYGPVSEDDIDPAGDVLGGIWYRALMGGQLTGDGKAA